MIAVEVSNRSGVEVDEEGGGRRSPASVLAAEGVEDGELGLPSSARTRSAR